MTGPLCARLIHLVEVDADSADIFTQMNALQFTGWLPAMMSQDKEMEGLFLMKMMRLGLAARNEVHTSDHKRRCMLLSFHAFSGAQSSAHQHTDWEWEELYGEGGKILIELAAEYDYDRMHIACKWPAYDQCISYPGWGVALAVRWGNLAACNTAFDRMLPFALRCMHDDFAPSDVIEIYYFKSVWVWWLYVLGRKDDARAVLHAGPFTELGSVYDYCHDNSAPGMIRPRGVTTGEAMLSADDMLMHAQYLDLLLAEELPPASALAALPGPHAASALGTKGAKGVALADIISVSTLVPCMLAHERVGHTEGALQCAAIILGATTSTPGLKATRMPSAAVDGESFADASDRATAEAEATSGASQELNTLEPHRYAFAHACRGRILATQGKSADAEVAFELAIEAIAATGWHFLTAIVLRDLCKHVLNGAGRGEEGKQRLDEAVAQLACSVEDLDAFVYP